LSDEPALKVRFFPLSLSRAAFSWFASLPHDSVTGWEDLESKFHQYFDFGMTEKGIADLVDLRQGSNESGSHFIQRFREMRNQCYSLTLSDEEVVSIAVRGLLPVVSERIGTDCSNFRVLAKKIVNLEAQYRYSRYNKAQKAANIGFEFGPPLEDIKSKDEEEENDEIAAVDWAWKHSEYIPWAKAKSVDDNKKYSFDISQADKIFDFLLEKGQIKLTGNHKIPSAEELKKKKYYKYHNSYNHSTNECKVFRELI
jgi:hypothetical protein